MICDFMELYLYLIDDFLIPYCQKLKASDFVPRMRVSKLVKNGFRSGSAQAVPGVCLMSVFWLCFKTANPESSLNF